MKKGNGVITLLFTVILLIVAVFVLSACVNEVPHKLTFIVDGNIYHEIETSGNETIKLPDAPTKEGYLFVGWYWEYQTRDRPFTIDSLLNEKLTANMSVYAIWEHITHEYVYHEGVEATCVSNGIIEYWSCSGCGELFSDDKGTKLTGEMGIPATGKHAYGDWITTQEPTCASAGEKERKCTVCCYDVEKGIVPATDEHSYSEELSGNAATHWHECSICGDIKERASHTWNTGEAGASPTCTVCEKKQYSDGLNYELNSTQDSYAVVSIGRATDTDIIIPSSYHGLPVTSIGDNAFYYCESLTSIAIPDSVTSIGDSAFSRCTSLISIIIPKSVTAIGSYAFSRPHRYPTIYCKTTSKPVGWNNNWNYNNCPVIWDCDNTDIADDGKIYAVRQGIRYRLQTNADNSKTAIVIGSSRFINRNIEIPANIAYRNETYPVISIDYNAFYDCESLTSITIPDSVTSIDYNAFEGCSSLKSVTIGNGVTSISGSAFEGCSSLTSITIPTSVTSIGYNAFYGCSSLTSIIIPDTVTAIGDDAFYGCSSLKSVTIGNGVTSISGSAFEGCSSLTSIMVEDGNPNYHSDGNCLIETGTKTLILGCNTSVIPTDGSVTSIRNYAFSGCSSLASINIPDTVTAIGNYAFYDCDSLTSVTIGNGVTTIGDYTFRGCSSLTSITMPDSVTAIGKGAFQSCSSLTVRCKTTSMPVGWDNDWNSSNCPVVWDCDNNDIADDGSIYIVIDGIRYELKSNVDNSITALVVRQSTVISGEIEIPANITYRNETYPVTSIGNYAFYDCGSLTSITIPDTVTSVGGNAFKGCSSLSSITIPFIGATKDGTQNTHFSYIFGASSPYYNSAYVPDSLKAVIITDDDNIGDSAFYNCSSITSITIPDTVTAIGNYAFYNCSSITSITIPDSITSIGNYAFFECNKLTEVYYSGTSEWWNYIRIGDNNRYLISATRYYYSATQPTESGNFWHYSEDGVTPIKW